MPHSGCTPRQPTPFEIRSMRPTISRSPEGRGGPVRWLRYQLATRGQWVLLHVVAPLIRLQPGLCPVDGIRHASSKVRSGKATQYTLKVRKLRCIGIRFPQISIPVG